MADAADRHHRRGRAVRSRQAPWRDLGRRGVGPLAPLSPIRQWDATEWPLRIAGEIIDFDPVALVRGSQDAQADPPLRRVRPVRRRPGHRRLRPARPPRHARSGRGGRVQRRTGVYVGSGGGSYQSQYEYFPLLTAAAGDLEGFGRELGDTVNPMWLLRTLPNNVLCHVGIRHGLKGPNACMTNHSISGMLAIVEAMQAVRARRSRPRRGGRPRCAGRAASGTVLPRARPAGPRCHPLLRRAPRRQPVR